MSHDPRAVRPADDDEQEINLGRYWQAVVLRWWLVLALVVAGIVVGYLTTLGGGRSYSAQTILYLGTPLAPDSATPVSSAGTQLASVNEIALAEATIKHVAQVAGMTSAQLRGNVATKGIAGITAGKVGTPAPVMAITVTGHAPKKIEKAADTLASVVIARTSAYALGKLKTLNAEVAYNENRLTQLRSQLAQAIVEKADAVNQKVDAATKLLLIEDYNSIINASQDRVINLERANFSLEQQVRLTQDFEIGSQLTKAAATVQVARSRANSIIVGAIIGLLLGIVAALLWEPVMRRVGRKPA